MLVGPPLEHVALPRRVVAARHHDVDDGVARRVGAVLAGRHVVEVLAGHGDLAAQEAVVDGLDLGQFRLGQHAAQVHVAVAVERLLVVVTDEEVTPAPARRAVISRLVDPCAAVTSPPVSRLDPHLARSMRRWNVVARNLLHAHGGIRAAPQ